MRWADEPLWRSDMCTLTHDGYDANAPMLMVADLRSRRRKCAYCGRERHDDDRGSCHGCAASEFVPC